MKWIKKISEVFDMNVYDTAIPKEDFKKNKFKLSYANHNGKADISDIDLKSLDSKRMELDNRLSHAHFLIDNLNKKLPMLKYLKLVKSSESPSFVHLIYEISNDNIEIEFSIKKIKDNYILDYESKIDNVVIPQFSLYKRFDNSELKHILRKINSYMFEFENYTEDKLGKRIY